MNRKKIKIEKLLPAVLVCILCAAGCAGAGEQQGIKEAEQADFQVISEEMAQAEEDSGEADGITETENAAETEDTQGNQSVSESQRPTKDQVLEMRAAVLEGMSEAEITRLTENIKVANLALERVYLNDRLFDRLSDPDDLYWNYVDEAGDIQIGWAVEEYDKESGLSYSEYAEKYGTPVMAYNRFDADNFIELMTEMRDSLKNDLLKADFDRMNGLMQQAKDTHDVECVKEIYHILHDMDYFLLRYGIEDVGKYVQDASTIGRYYGVLEVYSE